jgi:hypothetical protein
MVRGAKIKSQQTGFEITLPGSRVAGLKVSALFGDSDANEGAVCEVVDGALPAEGALYVTEAKEARK